jgi:uncharacterized repeat protein (TIGR03803 family)
VLHSFDGYDGDFPTGALVADSQLNIYGTTEAGGNNEEGTVFELTTKKETVLYSFCAQHGCTDGFTPSGGVIADSEGNLYGTTSYGGSKEGGIVFELEK